MSSAGVLPVVSCLGSVDGKPELSDLLGPGVMLVSHVLRSHDLQGSVDPFTQVGLRVVACGEFLCYYSLLAEFRQ